jgi:Tfp pilus assembly protein PilF
MTKSRTSVATVREVVANQRALGRRLNWLLALPLVIMAMIGYMFFTMDGRLNDVELGAKLVTIERFLALDRNNKWAVDQYEALAKSKPSAPIFTRLAILYFQLDPNDNETKALDYLKEAKKYDEKYWEINRTLTYIHTIKGRCREGIEAGQKAIDFDQLDANSFNNMAWLLSTCGYLYQDLNKAREYAVKAVALTQRKNPDFLDTLSEVQHKRGEHDLAQQSLSEAIAIAPNKEARALRDKFKERFPNATLAEWKEQRR